MLKNKIKSKIKWSQIRSLVKQGWKNVEIERKFNGAITSSQISRKKSQWAKEDYYTSDKYAKYRTPEYIAWRTACLKRDKYKCVVCGRGRPAPLQVDHIWSWSKYPEKRYDVENGRTLCVYHHKRTPNYGFKAKTYKNDIDHKEWEKEERELWKLKQIKLSLKKKLKT